MSTIHADCLEIFAEVSPQTFDILGELDANVRIRSLDDLLLLSYITDSLETLSRPTTAAKAQSWIYGLAEMYQERFEKLQLLAEAKSEQELSPLSPDTVQETALKNNQNGAQNGFHTTQIDCHDLKLVS